MQGAPPETRLLHARLATRAKRLALFLFPLSFCLPAGCAKPNTANIELRKEKQQLMQTVQRLERELEAHRSRLRGLEAQATTLPVLPQGRLDRLVTVHGIRLGRQTGGEDWDPSQAGDDGLKIHVVPVDENGEELKATGHWVIEAFDLSRDGEKRIGRWQFDPLAALREWHKFGSLRTYILTCPWQTPPDRGEITVRVEFTDELTGRRLPPQQRVVSVRPPAAPATTQRQQSE